MNIAYVFFLNLVFGSFLSLSASEVPLRKSGAISISPVQILIPEVNSYESDELHSNTTNSSPISPKNSHSPTRRPSEDEIIIAEFSKRLHDERIIQEEKDVLAKSHHSFPGDRAKLCTLEELRAAEKEALGLWLIED